MFLRERFPAIAPKPIKFPAIIMEEVMLANGSRGTKHSNTYKPRAWIWLNSKQATNKSLAKVIDKEERFCFRPYSYTPQGIMKPLLFDGMNEEIGLIPLETCVVRAKILLVIVAPMLIPCKLESTKDVLVYNPQRVHN